MSSSAPFVFRLSIVITTWRLFTWYKHKEVLGARIHTSQSRGVQADIRGRCGAGALQPTQAGPITVLRDALPACSPPPYHIFIQLQGYHAPEVLQHLRYSYPVDIYGVGIVLFILLHGYSPFW